MQLRFLFLWGHDWNNWQILSKVCILATKILALFLLISEPRLWPFLGVGGIPPNMAVQNNIVPLFNIPSSLDDTLEGKYYFVSFSAELTVYIVQILKYSKFFKIKEQATVSFAPPTMAKPAIFLSLLNQCIIIALLESVKPKPKKLNTYKILVS